MSFLPNLGISPVSVLSSVPGIHDSSMTGLAIDKSYYKSNPSTNTLPHPHDVAAHTAGDFGAVSE